jgi:hypothetical protein
MALVTAKQVSEVAIPLLRRSLVLPMTVARVAGTEFSGDNGDTVVVRVPQPGSARKQTTRGDDIHFDDINEVGVDLKVFHLYHAKLISDEERTLDIINFASQITAIQVAAVAEGAENELSGELDAVTADETGVDGSDAAAVKTAILEARKALSDADVPASDRYMAVGTSVASAILNIPDFTRVDASGDDDALRNAVIGRLYGFTFVESNAIDTNSAVAYHRTGFVMANRAPIAPQGAADAATVSDSGLAMRQVFQYQPDKLSDASVLSTFAGAKLVDADRVYKFEIAS